MEEDEDEGLERLSVILVDTDRVASECGDDCGRGCSNGFRVEWVNVDRNAFRARTWRLASSEAPSGFTGREKFTFLGTADGVRPASVCESRLGLDSTLPWSCS